MPLETLLFFLPACFALNMAFGPNNLLSVTIGARFGLRAALLAASGRIAAFVVMIAVAGLGMGALLVASEAAFTIVKLLGAAYLVWLGLRIWRSKADLPVQGPRLGQGGLRGLVRQEFLVAAGNPKAILIFTAFLPQFAAPDRYAADFLLVGTIFLALELVAIAVYAYAGTHLSGVMRSARGLRWVQRVSGGTMIAFGALLAVARRPAT